jgi:hypothetical protein
VWHFDVLVDLLLFCCLGQVRLRIYGYLSKRAFGAGEIAVSETVGSMGDGGG